MNQRTAPRLGRLLSQGFASPWEAAKALSKKTGLKPQSVYGQTSGRTCPSLLQYLLMKPSEERTLHDMAVLADMLGQLPKETWTAQMHQLGIALGIE